MRRTPPALLQRMSTISSKIIRRASISKSGTPKASLQLGAKEDGEGYKDEDDTGSPAQSPAKAGAGAAGDGQTPTGSDGSAVAVADVSVSPASGNGASPVEPEVQLVSLRKSIAARSPVPAPSAPASTAEQGVHFRIEQ